MTIFYNDWNFSNLEYLIQDRGENVLHEKGLACPCRKQDHYGSTIEYDGKPATQRSIRCGLCDRNGFVYRDPQIIRGLVTMINPGNRSLIDIGRAEPGDATFSPSLCASSTVTDFDKITMCFPMPIDDGQQIMRNSANIGENASLGLGVAEDEDRLWYYGSQALWCEDVNGVSYSQDSDFIFDQKKIKWVGNAPAEGVFYTLKYTAYLEWIVYTTPQQRFDRNRELGNKVLLKKLHVAFPDDPLNTAQSREDLRVQFKTSGTL